MPKRRAISRSLIFPTHAFQSPICVLLKRDVARQFLPDLVLRVRSEEHTSELQSLMRISYAVFCLKKKKQQTNKHTKQEEREILTQHSTTNQIKHAYM